MRILDRYIILNILGIFIGTMFTFAFLFILIDTFGNLGDFIEKKVPYEIILQYYLSFLPVIIVNTATMSCLMAVLYTYSTLNSHNELIAVRSSGLNFWHITRPALIFACLISAFVFLVNERFVPNSSLTNQEIKQNQIKITLSEKSKGRPIIKNLTLYGLKNRLFFINQFDPNSNELTDITLLGHDQHQVLREKIVAQRGKWTGLAWKFYNCQITEFNTNQPNMPGDIKIYPEKLMDIKETPTDLLKQRIDVTSMNIKQLSEYIERFSGSGALKTIRNLKVDLYQKIAFPFRTLIIVLACLPFALRTGRRKGTTFAAIGIAVMMGFLYYVLDAVGLALGKGNALPPEICVWIAPAIFLVIAIFAIRKNF